MSIVTLGLDPIYSKLPTLGYGPDVVSVEVTVVRQGGIGRGTTGRRKKEQDQLIRVRVIDEDGKTMVQEQLFSLDEVKNVKIKINENETYIAGSDIYISINKFLIKEGETKTIRVKTHETSKRQNTDN